MSNIVLELIANGGEVLCSFSGEQDDVGINKPCRWKTVGGNAIPSWNLTGAVVSKENSSPYKVMMEIEKHAERKDLNDYGVKYGVKNE